MKELADITKDITKFGYNDSDISALFDQLKIGADDWPVESAKEEFDKIIERRVQSKPVSDNPHFTVVSGIPCSGKTTKSEELSKSNEKAILIQFDDIMEQLSYYQELHKEKGNILAFEKCEQIARIISYQLLKTSLDRGLDIIFDHSSAPEQHVGLYKLIQESYKYNAKMTYIEVSLDTGFSQKRKGKKKRQAYSS